MSTQKITSINNGLLDNDPPAAAPIPTNTLEDIVGDSQTNVVPVEAQVNGVDFDIPLWMHASDQLGEVDTVIAYIGTRPVGIFDFPGPITDDPVSITVQSSLLQQHGEKEIRYIVTLNGENPAESDPVTIFVDTVDPNLNNQPRAIELPADLPGNTLTPEYLSSHGNGITLTIPRPVDSRPGDTWQIRWGTSPTATLDGLVPDIGPINVFVSSLIITNRGEGDKAITYEIADRAGNFTQTSFPTTVNVQLSNPPTGLQPPVVVGAPLINKEMARNGVVVEVPTFTDYLQNDVVYCYWHGTYIGDQRLGLAPLFPLSFIADYNVVAAPGNEYDANVTYIVRRGGDDYGAPPASVEVNLTEPGVVNPGPGPEDPILELPLVKGTSQMDNVLIPSDRGDDAHATFTIYPGSLAGETIELYYGTAPGVLTDSYTVQGDEDPDFEVRLTIPWSTIDLYGNGQIPVYYKISNANNYKHSPSETVSVRVFVLEGLQDPVFEKVNANDTILCAHEPWLGVPIRIFDSSTLEPGDIVVVHAVRYTFNPIALVPGSQVDSSEYEVRLNDVQDGFTRELNLPYFGMYTETGGRGYVGITWSLFRPSSEDRGTSDEVRARWDVRSGAVSGTCVPGATRGH
ncbi:hypothetical protein AWM79_04395 [Pseudomonas agarici]|uniref:Uncharacterized protein n=1 Tax=Pseudomonas agarici TaxID=46677 RepID=A0A0X1SXN2_PSEAA|nr:hypothetical protein [Pseudomonas agarici]AMB84592.1 hypothetical protein AWM79_04395 [Pseudomonas agarici]